MNPTQTFTPPLHTSTPLKPSDSREKIALRILREHDQKLIWNDLGERRVCVLCCEEFEGGQIRIRANKGRIHFKCPTGDCRGSLEHFVSTGNPLIEDKVWTQWMEVLRS